MAKPARTTPVRGHSASDRPTVTRVDTLPRDAYLHTPRTPWGEIAYQLSRHPGDWFKLERPYSKLSGAIQLARKAADEHLTGDASSRLEFASIELGPGKVQVYLRLVPEDEPEVDLSARFDEKDSVHDELAATDSEYAASLDPDEAARAAHG